MSKELKARVAALEAEVAELRALVDGDEDDSDDDEPEPAPVANEVARDTPSPDDEVPPPRAGAEDETPANEA